MFYSKSVHICEIDENVLDSLLAKGWYRAGSRFFTSSFLLYQNYLYNTIWLRINLHNFSWSPKMLELAKRNSKFMIQYSKFEIDDEMCLLFTEYKNHVKFIQSSNLHEYIYGSMYEKNDSMLHCIKLYHGEALIGCGVYEVGNNSFEGLVSFYHGEYKKYSLGRYLMMCKINQALRQGYKYFYMGYYVPNQPKFDYKLSISPNYLEYYCPKRDLWFQYSEYFGFIDELEKQKKACHQMEEILKERGVDVKTKIYPFFEYNIHYNFGLAYPVTVPYMVIINPDQSLESDIFDIVVYDVRKEIFRIFTVERFGMIYLTPFMGNPDYFSDSIIVIIMELASGNAETIIQYVEETINY